ncbi:AT hook motif DNA-binding family protein [Klebsormidium nitens]|uniref:AT-hook motif nuclear-localized protein n=1 Tax=Klebsormidium nitens TaxID=105231 RepID=A0A0U9I728_KLENI|nr:AT hook motif DNA-binding family protein [Klebsormidium nitens]|eukprot:GAQ81965.1 AT hook motif DNA-binding family protein [Klebsormidium nitens]
MGHASQPLRPNFTQAIASGLMPVPQPEQEVQKKKRGRPRKDATVDGSVPLSPEVQGQKRGRGRPPGSGKKQKEAMAAAGEGGLAPPIGIQEKKGRGRPPTTGAGAAGNVPGITPQVISVVAGEDVNAKVLSFPMPTTRAMVILSASGTLSAMHMKQSNAAGGVLALEGSFDILSLSGSFLSTDGGRQRLGSLSICVSAPDGRVIGGVVAGTLKAVTPVQVLVGTFPATGAKVRKPRAPKQPKPAAAGAPTGLMAAAMSPVHAQIPNHGTGGTGIELNS